MKYCKDCEPAQEIHWVAYLSVVLEYLGQPFFDFMEILFKSTAEAISRKSSIPFLRLMVFLGFAHFSEHPDSKGIMKVKFQKEGLPVADGGTAFTKSKALKIFNRLKKPVITKPNLGSRSRHTLIHIDTEKKLIYGFKKAKKLSPLVVIEEELRGYLFRATLVNGKLVGVVRRDQPEVIGNGIHTLKELMDKENERPERKGPIFHKIVIDPDTEIELKCEGVGMKDIPKKDRVITFSQKTSRGIGGTTTEVTDIIHPENVKMLEKLGTYLKDPLVGVDFIIEDITQPWFTEQHCGIIECNSLPFIDLHHYPLFGKPNNVAGKLWDLVMPESKV